MKFTIVPAFYNKPDYLQNLADSIKGHLEVMTMIIYYSPTTEFQNVTSKTDITKSHCKIESGSCFFCYRHQCYETINKW
jgi:ferrochelatase